MMDMKHKDILTMIDDKLEQKIRDEKIRTLWGYMKNWTDIKYKVRIQHLMEQFHLSYKRIEQIVREGNE